MHRKLISSRISGADKLDIHKKVKRKSKTNQKNKIINQPVANLASGTLILSSGKIMPVVTPMTPLTSNIIVNAQSQSTNPIILSNAQPNQMIVMQHHSVQNSVIPVCNQALINAVQKVTMNTVPNIQTNMVVSSHDWVSNVKSIINATKITGRKSILPKGREITKTTMTYKVPIPAVHKEKHEKTKETASRREPEVKIKQKNCLKGTKSGKMNNVEEKPKTMKKNSDSGSSEKDAALALPSKRTLNQEKGDGDEPENKKPRIEDEKMDSTSTCKSIESLKNVVEKIGTDMSEETQKIDKKEKSKSPARDDSGPIQTVDSGDLTESQNSNSAEKVSSGVEKPEILASRDVRETEENLTATPTFFPAESLPDKNDKPEESPAAEEQLSSPNDPTPPITSDIGEISEENRKEDAISDGVNKAVCNLGTRFDSLLQANVKRPEILENVATLETSKIILNLDTHTMTTLKSETNTVPKPVSNEDDGLRANKLNFAKDEGLKSLSYSADNSFIPISRTEALHSDLSNDIFASLQVPSSSHHPESISPTAAFLMAFPLVSSLNGKTEVLEEEMKEDFKYRSQTPPMLLQIGAMEPNSFKLKTNTNLPKENLTTGQHAEERNTAGLQKYAKATTESHAAPKASNDQPEAKKTDLKSMPKIIHSENLKEPYKIVQTSIPSSLTTPIEMNNTFVYTSATSTVSYSAMSAVTTCSPAQIQSTSIVHHNRPVAVKNSQNIAAESINVDFQTPAETHTPVSKYDMRSQYSSTQNFMPNYPNIGGNVELPQYTPPTFTRAVQKVENSTATMSGLTQCHGVAKTQNYPVQNKESHPNQNESLRSKQSHENYQAKKVGADNFGDNFTVNPHQGVHDNQNMYQEKHTSPQSYMPYSKDSKKIIGSMNSVAVSSGKPILENTVHYSQNQMVGSSNYEHSTVTENNVKSTTTVAHNSSNFSILSWTTFSPVGGGNNNTMNYEQGQTATDNNTDNKTVCENFGYVPLHKDNVGFSNMLPDFQNESGLNVNKLGNKPLIETQKQAFIDQTKAQNIAPQKQNQNPSVDYKFNNDNKGKGKYTIENNFMQTNYTNMEQQKHQSIANKQDKSNYPMPNYNHQALFNAPETAPQAKYSTENYTGANFKYTEKPQQNQKYQSTGQSQATPLEQVNSVYKQTQNGLKSKTQQIRPPVNWMMTPEIKHNTNISDIILPPIGKELEYCQNNLFTQNTSYNQTTTNQFYNNYDATHGFPNIPVLQNEPKKVDALYTEEQPFSWSPTKNTHVVEQTQSIKPIDQHIVPSTLPTLVGDLALGTNIPEKQNFLFGQIPARLPTEHNKDLIKEKDANAGREFHHVLNPQNGQHAVPFLSVSQLVDHEKVEKSQQARKHQRKSTSPRGSGKRQIEIRKPASDQLHHEEQKSSFPEQNYQQKYQQNDNSHWRNRNCKSNYTAEALIGTNTNVQDDNQQEKHASIKFTANYGQNKFPGALAAPTEAMMPINYFPNADDGSNYGQATNQNFNSYPYSSNANIYPTTSFMTSMSNTPTSYMMPLHENSDYLEANSFLLPNAASTNPIKTQHYTGKHQNCEKRSYSTAKRSKRKPADMAQNIEFPIAGINSPLEDYHPSFLSHTNLYQNHTQSTIYPKTVNTPMAGNQNTVGSAGLPMNSNIPRGTSSNSPMVMAHPSGTSLTNFNLSTIFPEINDKAGLLFVFENLCATRSQFGSCFICFVFLYYRSLATSHRIACLLVRLSRLVTDLIIPKEQIILMLWDMFRRYYKILVISFSSMNSGNSF